MKAILCALSCLTIVPGGVATGEDGLFVRSLEGGNTRSLEDGHIVYKVPARKAMISKVWLRRDTDWEENSRPARDAKPSGDPFSSVAETKPIQFWLVVEFDSAKSPAHKSEFQPADPGDGYLVILQGKPHDNLDFTYRGGSEDGRLSLWALGIRELTAGRKLLSKFAQAYGLDAANAVDKTE